MPRTNVANRRISPRHQIAEIEQETRQPDWDTSETKTERFHRVMEPRVNRAVKNILSLKAGANRNNYAPTEVDVVSMEEVLRMATEAMLEKYKPPKKEEIKFQFPRDNVEEPETEDIMAKETAE